MSSPNAPTVAISAGFSKTHMTTAAREMADRGQLAVAITAAYPTRRITRRARALRVAGRGRVARLMERDERLPEERLRVVALPELLFDAARPVGAIPKASDAAERLCAATWRLYGRRAGRELLALPTAPDIYHFRAGFGQHSVDCARQRGMHVLCDHAIVHPAVLQALVDSRGCSREVFEPASQLDRLTVADIEKADSILVNSEFARETFLACGWPRDRVHVVYLGVDENFMRAVPTRPRRPSAPPLRLLFAGRLERRKGADVLIEALSQLEGVPWELAIAGPVAAEIWSEHRTFFEDPRVSTLGTVSRPELARQMAAAPVFVFPSYAEGSARAVFEALASGCYVITTPNSGTIVEDGVHGALVPPGDAAALSAAVAAAGTQPERVAEIGNRNAALIRTDYRQSDYGDGLQALYRRLSRVTRPMASAYA